MSYIEGFVTAVPAANKDAYIAHAREFAPLIRGFGATRMVECWGDDVPDGKLTDFKGAVQAKPDEVVVFSWFEYPDRAARKAANDKLMADPRMEAMSKDMPFDGKRMIYGGFDSLLDEGLSDGVGYTDGYLVAVPEKNRDAYRQMAEKACKVFREYGALRVVEAWGDDVQDGKLTDYRRAVKAEDGEAVVYSFVEWPSKAVRDEAWGKIMEDERMTPDGDMPFDGKRMIYGGFSPIVDA